MNDNVNYWFRKAVTVAAAVMAVGVGTNAMAQPKAMDNSELADVVAGDGLSIVLNLQFHADRVSRGFEVGGVTTFATLQDVGGGMLLHGVTIDARAMPGAPGESYIDVGMPSFVAFDRFGFNASGVTTDPQGIIQPTQNFGGVQLHGTAAMTGHFLIWAK